MKLILGILLCLMLIGCASPYVVGISKTSHYLSDVYDVNDTTIYGVGWVPGTYGCVVVGYNRTIVRTISTGAVYEAAVKLKEFEILRGVK